MDVCDGQANVCDYQECVTQNHDHKPASSMRMYYVFARSADTSVVEAIVVQSNVKRLRLPRRVAV